jgi:antitoxin VapB
MKTAKLFRNGQSQAVRLPKEFRFEGEQVFIQRAGNAVVLLPIDAPFQTLFDSLSLFTEDFSELPAHEAVSLNAPDTHGN